MASLINQQITLDLIPGPVVKTVSVSQYDTGTRTLKFRIQNDGADFTIPSGLTVTIQATKKDLTGFSYACTYSGSIVSVVVQPQMTVFAGKTMCEIVFASGNDRIGSANFWLKVEDAALNTDTTISETVIPGIANLEQALQTAVQKADQALQSASDAEAWAVGTRNGTAVPSTDATYHNNSKYYADTFDGDITRVEGLVEQAEALVDSLYSLAIVSSATGDPAVITDGADRVPMKSLVASIEPKQDLHGYDKPWVGGAGKNLLPTRENDFIYQGITAHPNGDGTFTITGTATALTDATIAGSNTPVAIPDSLKQAGTYKMNGGITGLNGATGNTLYVRISDGTNVRYVGNNGSNFTTFTLAEGEAVTGSFIRIASGTTATGQIIKPMIVRSTETDTTFAPYQNIAPISGWDAVGVTRTSGNLGWVTDQTYTNRSVTAVCFGNKIKLSGTATGGNASFIIGGGSTYSAYDRMVIGEFPAGTYRVTSRGFVGQGANDRLVVGAFENDGTVPFQTSRISSNNGTSPTGQTITFTASKPFKLFYYIAIDSGHTVDCTAEVELRRDSDPFDYSDSVWNKYSVSLSSAGTVYGGTLDVVSGKLVVDRARVDMGSLTWSYNETRFATQISNITMERTRLKGICDAYPTFNGSVAEAPDHSLIFNNATIDTLVKTSMYTDPAVFKTAVTGRYIVYKLNTPQTYQLTPTQVTTLLRNNSVWADCGSVALEYAVDTKTYIDSLIGAQS